MSQIKIPNGITTVENFAFYGCSSLAKIEIPDSVTFIGNYAFCKCSKLAQVNIPEGIIRIGTVAFTGCESLTAIITTKNNIERVQNLLVAAGTSSLSNFVMFGNNDKNLGCAEETVKWQQEKALKEGPMGRESLFEEKTDLENEYLILGFFSRKHKREIEKRLKEINILLGLVK